ncbi:Chromosome partition protein MukB [Klebsiella pneumoniae]|uniref:hypothetical protein n=1 Tax=Klebsiella pneumoniae TaxID=573 RepID=UPI000F0E661B|nr:hypothetical protein [Klebsiella pneumoniae]VCW04559.1 Chromosome partition protein MukB [Klebsiella pneumoniae]
MCRNPAPAPAFSRFIGSHLAVAFEDDPEEEIRNSTAAAASWSALSAHESDNQQNRVQYEQAKEGVSALNRLLPRLNLLADDTLADRVDEIQERLDEAQEAARFIQQHGNQLAKLEPIVSVLQSDPEQFEQLKEDYAYAQQTQRDARQQAFARRKLCSAGPTSAPIRRKCSAATAIQREAAPASGAGGVRTQPRARRDACPCGAAVSTIRCWPR